MGNLIERAEALLKSRNVRFTTEERSEGWTQIRIDTTPESDFSFFLVCSSDGNADLGAHRLAATGRKDFFDLPYELEDFNGVNALEAKVLQDLELLISNPVRVHRTRGLFCIDSKAEVVLGSETKVLYGASGLHWSFPFHKDLGRTVTFQATALTTKATDG